MRHLRSARHRRLIEVCVEARQAAGLSQRELAKLLKRSPSYVSKFEAGERRLEVCEFVDFAEACGVDAVELFRRFMR
jgi:transcriptional regulator with XRE-family HTH domain